MKIKRIYENPEPDDGYRMLIDRIWPRGVKKEEAMLDEWNKDIAPSTELRKWFGHQQALFEEFSKRYKAELSNKAEALEYIKSIADKQQLTLLYAAKDKEMNNAQVLSEVIQQMK